MELTTLQSEKEDNYEEIIEISDSLQDSYVEKRVEDESKFYTYSKGAWFTGLEKATIYDFTVEEDSTVVLHAKTSNNQKIEIPVENNDGAWDEAYELPRLIKQQNLVERRVEPLLDKEITVYVESWRLPSDIPYKDSKQPRPLWRVYIPETYDRVGRVKHRFNRIARYTGRDTGFKFQRFLNYSLVSWSLFVLASMATIFYTNSYSVTIPQIQQVLLASIAYAFIGALLAPLILRFGALVSEKYVKYRKSNTLVDNNK
jgi:hypothetical protein